MITGELKNKVDKLWEMFWTGGLTNPLDVIEQITYLMFIRDLDLTDNTRQKESGMLGIPYISIFKDKEHLKWSALRDKPAETMYQIMQGEVFPFIKGLNGNKNSTYAKYMGDAIFKVPTPQLLGKIVAALDEMYELIDRLLDRRDARGDLYEYMLSKLSTAGTNGQFRTPRHIIRMMVELLDLRPNDIICDPACGTGGFLVEAGEYLEERYFDEIFYNKEAKYHYDNAMFTGYDMDRTMLRIDKYRNEDDFASLTYENTLQIAEHIAPLVLPVYGDASAARFDILVYQIELALMAGKSNRTAKNDVIHKAAELSKYGTIPAVAQQQELIGKIVHNDFLERAEILDFEDIRMKLRDLIQFIPENDRVRYDTDFTDDILSMESKDPPLDNGDLENYKKKVDYYILQHQDIPVIARLKGNQPLTPEDVRSLESILWNELGTKAQYDRQYGRMPLGELVRSIVGLDRKAANEAFSRFLNDAGLNSRQMCFVKQIVNYIVKNGMMKDLSVLQESPFTDRGTVSELFDDAKIFMDIRAVIEEINRNAMVA